MNNLQFDMIINGMRQDQDGNYILNSHEKTSKKYKKVKSRFRQYIGSKSGSRKSVHKTYKKMQTDLGSDRSGKEIILINSS